MFVQVQTFSISWFWGILDFLQEKFHYINYRTNAEIKRSDLMCQVTWPINQSEWTIKHSLVALLIKFVYDVISCHVYIFCLLQTLSAPLWFIWPIFSPDIQADFVALPISPVLVPPPFRPILNQNNINLLHSCTSVSSGQFKNCNYFSNPFAESEKSVLLFFPRMRAKFGTNRS